MDNSNQVQVRKSSSSSSPTKATSSLKSKKSNKTISYVIGIVVLIVLFFGGYFALQALNKSNSMGGVKTSQYQAVFLTNGQAYFGKIKSINSNFIDLTSIYYLQAQQNGQPAETQPKATTSQANLSLIKLGGEIHGPESEMFIARDQVLFWENLKNSGQVVKAIERSSNN
jgi:hypothetical protein